MSDSAGASTASELVQSAGATGPAPGDAVARELARPRWWKIVLQAVGWVASLALLVWVISSIINQPGVRDRLPRLLETPWWLIALLVALSTGTIVFSGLVFWAALRPIRRLGVTDTVAVNAAATLLGVLPFKLNFAYRVLTHMRRDGMTFLQVMSWMVATAIIILMSLAGVVLAGVLKLELNFWWWLLAMGVPTLGGLCMFLLGRRLLRMKVRERYASRPWMHHLVNGVLMLSNERCVVFALIVRFFDIACHTVRFFLAGEAAMLAGFVDTGLTADQAVLAGSLYFFVQIVSPTGSMGLKEAATMGVLAFMASESFGIIVIVVSTVDAAATIVMGVLGLWWLRPDKYFFGAWRKHSAERLAELAKMPPPPEYPLGDAARPRADQPDRRRP